MNGGGGDVDEKEQMEEEVEVEEKEEGAVSPQSDNSFEQDILTSSDDDADEQQQENNEKINQHEKCTKWWLHDFGHEDTINYYRRQVQACYEKRKDKFYDQSEKNAFKYIQQATTILDTQTIFSNRINNEFKKLAIEYYKLAEENFGSLLTRLYTISSEDVCIGLTTTTDETDDDDNKTPISLIQYITHMCGVIYVIIMGLLIQCQEYDEASQMMFQLATHAPNHECREMYQYGIKLLYRAYEQLENSIVASEEKQRKRRRLQTYSL